MRKPSTPEETLAVALAIQFQNRPRINEKYELVPLPTQIFNGIEDRLAIIPVQKRYPDIVVVDREDDIILKRKRIMAIEVKYLKDKKQHVAYEGIDQAASLLLYGFDYVALFHVYDERIIDEIDRGQLAWQTIRMLNIPIDFSLYLVRNHGTEDEPNFKFSHVKASWIDYAKQEGMRLEDPDYDFRWKYPNPLRNENILHRMKELQNIYDDMLRNAQTEARQFRMV